MKSKRVVSLVAFSAVIILIVVLSSLPAAAFHEAGPILLSSHENTWTDPDSGGQLIMTENVYEGCVDVSGVFIPHDMTWEYSVENVSYDPIPGITNGFSGFQIVFPGPVAELYNQQSPAVGGPWEQNAYSGRYPPFGVEWDVQLPGVGIMPLQTGVFTFCTYEREDVVNDSEGSGQGPAGWAHTWGLPVPEPIIDADGTASPLDDSLPGFVEVAVLDPLTPWPTGFWNEGLDMFDNDNDAAWTFGPNGDDLHVEDPTTHPGAIRDGNHDDFLDPLVLDIDGSLDGTPGREPVSCDMETGTFCPAGLPGNIKFYDSLNPNGFWDDGEDIVLDSNGNGIFGEVVNTQTFIFYGEQSVPGELLYALDLACSDGHEVCKKAKYMDEDGDGIIEVGERIDFLEVIQVHNPTGDTWTDVTVEDRFGAELGVTIAAVSAGEAVTMQLRGKSEKVYLKWEIPDLGPGLTANLVLHANTDLTPDGSQSYTECSWHEFNSGAVLKFRTTRKHSFETGGIMVSVLTVDAQGDCDGGGVIDARELAVGTDPHDPADEPTCGHPLIGDICIDADGTVSPQTGLPAAQNVVVFDALASFPVTGATNAGLDWFDNDQNGLWSSGDDLHSEDTGTCPTAIRDGDHDLGLDCKILDLNGDLADQQQVDCDLEVNFPFTEPHLSNGGCPSTLNNIRYHDVDNDGSWDDGEDIILDMNGNGVFD